MSRIAPPAAATAPAAAAESSLRAAFAAVRPYLTFVLARETYAVEIAQVREIIEYGHVTEVPMMPPAVRGVINLRGAVVPVIDLAARFGRERAQVARRTCIVIVEVPHDDALQTLGVMVDAVVEVLEVDASDIEPPPSFGVRIRTDFIAGMARVGGRFVVVLDATRVFSIDELADWAALAAPGAPPPPAVQ